MNNTNEIKSKIINNEEHNKKEFKKYICNHMKGQKMKNKDLAEKLGVKTSYITKIISADRPAKHRDCIIAICFQLKLSPAQTNKAIYLNDKNMPLLSYRNKRDEIFIRKLDILQINPFTINEINDELTRNGFSPLLIVENRSTKENKQNETNNIKILDKIVTINYDDSFFDEYNSIETTYNLLKYKGFGKMLLKNSDDDKYYVIHTNSSGYVNICEYKKKDNDYIFYERLDETHYKNFIQLIDELNSHISSELKETYNIVNDTKNYIKRVSAKFHEDSICLFAESYNYNFPELNEYHYCELKNNNYVFYISNESIFMMNQLSTQEYKKYYGEPKECKLIKFNSLDEIEEYYNKSNKKYNKQYVKKAFLDLQKDIQSLFNKIKNKETFIRNLNYIWEPIEQNLVCKYYGLEKEFNLHEVAEEFGTYLDANESAMVINHQTNEQVLLTLNDLYKAFELGFNTKEEIIQIKKKYETIDAILNK